jgi:hypothetical protein
MRRLLARWNGYLSNHQGASQTGISVFCATWFYWPQKVQTGWSRVHATELQELLMVEAAYPTNFRQDGQSIDGSIQS